MIKKKSLGYYNYFHTYAFLRSFEYASQPVIFSYYLMSYKQKQT
jgi:hypothetical protein